MNESVCQVLSNTKRRLVSTKKKIKEVAKADSSALTNKLPILIIWTPSKTCECCRHHDPNGNCIRFTVMRLKVTYENSARTLSVRIGISLIALGFALILACIIGALQFSSFEIAGHSGLRSLAGVAVFGCMMAALGSFE